MLFYIIKLRNITGAVAAVALGLFLMNILPNISDYEWDRYIARYYTEDDAVLTEDEVRVIAEDQLEHLNTHCHTVPAGTDSEGVSYNTTIDDTEIPAK